MMATRHTRYVGQARGGWSGAVLRLGPEAPSLVWSRPSANEWAVGLGVAGDALGEVEWLDAPVSAPPGPFFGGWAFDHGCTGEWSGFDAERWILPEVLGWWNGQEATLAAFGPWGTPRATLEARLALVTEVEPVTTSPLATSRASSRSEWTRLVRGALGAIREGRFEKVVVARVIDVDGHFTERSILKSLEARGPTCATFLLRGADGTAFLGSTPELLIEARQGAVVKVDALAGTAAVGEGAHLLGSEKERLEHQIVVDVLAKTLAPFTDSLTVPSAPVVRALGAMAHLHTPIRGVLRQGIDPVEVARALHPTPAVAGWPREAAMTWLREREGFSRGWYAGAVGHRGPSGCVLAVAIRSALVRGTTARVFAGAGIVEGSEPDAEWLETERKAAPMLAALGAPHV